MKSQTLIRASIIIVCTILFAVFLPNISPLIIILSTFTIIQLVSEINSNLKEIKQIKQSYENGLLKTYLNNQYYKIALDIITLLIWFALVLFLFRFIPETFV